MQDKTHQTLWDLLDPVVAGEGYELVDLDYRNERGWVLRVYVDRPDVEIVPGLGVAPGQGIQLDECVSVSRQISALLDVEEVISRAYALEVSSPGVQRPLRRPKDFERFAGCQVRVRTHDPITSQNPKITVPSRNMMGTLSFIDEQTIEIDVNGSPFRIPVAKITKAHLEPDMDAWVALANQKRNEEGE